MSQQAKHGTSPRWTNKEHLQLIELVRKHGNNWTFIADKMDRSYSSVQAHFHQFGPDDLKEKFSHRCIPDLTPEQIEEAKCIRARGKHGRMEIARVAKIMGVRPVQLLRVFMPHEVARKKFPPKASGEYERAEIISVPPEVWAERNRAMSRDRWCAAELLGDPPLSRSALGKKLAGLAA